MFWNIIIAIASYALQLALTPKPQNAKPKSLEDFDAPTAEEGREIPVVFGTEDIADPNVTWYGDLKRSAIKGARRYGLFGPRQILGYKYSLGMQMGLCHGPADAIYSIRVGDKEAWKGIRRGSGRITINKPKLFGGDQSEGGIKGDVDICMGAPDQLQNDYLKAKLGDNISAFRGVVTAVLRQVYLGTSNYIKPWEFRVQRVKIRSDGSDQWYKAKAAIGSVAVEDTAIFFSIDVSGSMNDDGRLANMKTALVSVLETIRDNSVGDVDIMMVGFNTITASQISKFKAQPEDYDDLIAWVNALTAFGDTDFEVAVAPVADFFDDSGDDNRRIFILLTDGLPTVGDTDAASAELLGIDRVEAFAFNIDLEDTTQTEKFDNTPDDGVPVVEGGDPQAIEDAITFAFEANVDMNPAHIIRECLTDSNWGMGYNDADIDDVSFTACADTFYAEKFGLSFKWSQEAEIEEFVSTVLSHVDAMLYTSRSTGKFVLKAIRDDYDIDLIPVLTEDDVVEWTESKRRQPSEASNSVLLKFYWRAKRKNAAHLVTNLAQAMQATKVLPTTRQYEGITNSTLAIKVATRDVIALGSGLASGRVIAKRTVAKLNPGDPFRLVSSRHRFSGEVMRVADLNFGDGRQNKIGIKYFQDVFRLGASVLVDDSNSGGWVPPSGDALPVSPRLVWEMPFRELRQMVGDADLATMLAENADAGLLQLAGASPTSDAANAQIEIDAGSGYEEGDFLDFAPGAFLDGDLAIDATSVTVRGAVDFDEVVLGTFAAIVGATPQLTEVIRIDAVAGATLTIARGCFDTVPLAHEDGAPLVLFDDLNTSDFEVRTAGDEVAVKLLTITGADALDIGDAPADTVTFASRGIRPLRPANIKLETDGYGPFNVASNPVGVTLAERNRLTELDSPPSWTDATVTPEDGQTSIIIVYNIDGATEITRVTGITGTSYSLDVATALGSELSGILEFKAERDGYESWTGHRIEVRLPAPGERLLSSMDELDPASYRLTSGDQQSGTDKRGLSGDQNFG